MNKTQSLRLRDYYVKVSYSFICLMNLLLVIGWWAQNPLGDYSPYSHIKYMNKLIVQMHENVSLGVWWTAIRPST